ncbi:MAG: helix-turn-helix domain-containing protein [Propionibacteriaceae bacterium]|nr:helix-turn-helix domain-containing protein [Propionibacteriaceae bacterium]
MNHDENPDHPSRDYDLLTVSEAAKLLRISRNLAYELVARHELPAIRLGRVIRIPRPALDAWMEEQAKATNPASAGANVVGHRKSLEDRRWLGASGSAANRHGS